MHELKNLATSKKILSHTWSLQPPVSLSPVWPPCSSSLATFARPHFPRELFNRISPAWFLLNFQDIYKYECRQINKSKCTERWPNRRKGDRGLQWPSVWKILFCICGNLQFTHSWVRFYQAFAAKIFVGWENYPQSWNPYFLGVHSPVWLFKSGGDPV